ncbi:MAG: ABC transporter ATP-binding protein [Candidatus Bipolaricaulia bacterium]
MKLTADSITFAYVAGHDVLRDVTVSVDAGEVLFVLGANGSGKTTLLDCLAGLRAPHRGHVFVDGDPIERIPLNERAKHIGVVPQIHEPVFDYTVGEVVLMGRAPHLGLFARPGRRDREAVERALDAVGLKGLRGRVYTEISGGERQLALIARGLAQGAACLLMDEPAAHLDPHHQRDIFAAVSNLAADGFSFVVTSHQPNNALLYSDRVAFLIDGRVEACGAPAETMTEEALESAYGIDFELIRGANGSRAILPRVSRGVRS